MVVTTGTGSGKTECFLLPSSRPSCASPVFGKAPIDQRPFAL